MYDLEKVIDMLTNSSEPAEGINISGEGVELYEYFDQLDYDTLKEVFEELNLLGVSTSNFPKINRYIEYRTSKEKSKNHGFELLIIFLSVLMSPLEFHDIEYYEGFNSEDGEDYTNFKLDKNIKFIKEEFESLDLSSSGYYIINVEFREYILRREYPTRPAKKIKVYSPIITIGKRDKRNTLSLAFNGTTQQVSFKVNDGAVNYIKIETDEKMFNKSQYDRVVQKAIKPIVQSYL